MKNQITLTAIFFFHFSQALGLFSWPICQIFLKSNTSALLNDKTDNPEMVMVSFPVLIKSLMYGIRYGIIT